MYFHSRSIILFVFSFRFHFPSVLSSHETREMMLSIFKATFPERFVWPLFSPRVKRLFIYLLKSFEWDRAGWENLIFWQHPNTQRRAVLPVLQGRGEWSSTRKTTNAWILCLGYSRSRAVKGIRGRSNWIHGAAMGKIWCVWCISPQTLSRDEICSRAVDKIRPMTRFTERRVLILVGSLPFTRLPKMQFCIWSRSSEHGVDTADLQLNHPHQWQEAHESMMTPRLGRLVFLTTPAR